MLPQPKLLRVLPTKIATTGLLVLFLAFGACTNPRNVTALIYLAKEVIQLVDKLVDKSDSLTARVNKVTAITITNINSQKDVGDIAKFWEKQWMEIHSGFDDLNAHLQMINQRSAEYFQELDNNNSMISNEALKEQDFAKNVEIKKRWQVEYQKALMSVSQTEQMLREGDDFMYVLRNEVLRSKVSDSISSLKQIASQAANLSTSIKSFELRAKTIFRN